MKTDLVNMAGTWIKDNGGLPKRAEKDIYYTPTLEVEQAYQFLLDAVPEYHNRSQYRSEPFHILDVGAGNGVWGKVARSVFPWSVISGVELRDLPKPRGYDSWQVGDFVEYAKTYPQSFPKYDLVIGNPPYYIDSECVTQGMSLLKEGGHLLFLLKLSFIAGQKRLDTVYKELGLKAFGVYSRRIRWVDMGPSPVREHGLYLFQKGGKGRCRVYLVGTEQVGIVPI